VGNIDKYLRMQDLNEISFRDFIALHKINPRVYMLNCDRYTEYEYRGEIPLYDRSGLSNARRFQMLNAKLRQQQLTSQR